MEDFLIKNYSILTKAIIIIAALTGLFFYKNYRNTVVRFFIYYLICLVFIELVASYPRYFIKLNKFHFIEGTIFEKNYWWYTLFWNIGSALFFSFYFRRIFNNVKHIKIIKGATFLFLILSICLILINIDGFFGSFIPVINIGGILLIILCITFYFIEVMSSDSILKFHKSLNFYISSTLLIYFLVTTPLIFYDIYSTKSDMDYVILKWIIRLCSNIFMYLTFAFAFIWCKSENS